MTSPNVTNVFKEVVVNCYKFRVLRDFIVNENNANKHNKISVSLKKIHQI